nr:immunoglobulin light chain junction region [Macaca mulatta]
CQQGYTFLYSF